MAWKPTEFLLSGLLDNRRAGRVTGWLKFAGLPLLVLVDLGGDFEADIRGGRIRLNGSGDPRDARAGRALTGFDLNQAGTAVRMTANRPAMADRAHLEWHGDRNGTVILDLDPYQVHVVGEPMLFRPRTVPFNVHPFAGVAK